MFLVWKEISAQRFVIYVIVYYILINNLCYITRYMNECFQFGLWALIPAKQFVIDLT